MATPLFLDSMVGYTTVLDKWKVGVGNITVAATSGPRGGPCLQVNSNGQMFATVNLASAQAHTYTHLRLNPITVGAGGRNIFQLKDSGANQIEVNLQTDGTLIVLRNGTALANSGAYKLPLNEYHFIELDLLVANSGGTVNLRVDEISRVTFTGDTQNTANASVNQLQIGDTGSFSAASTIRWADIYVNATGLVGDIRVDGYVPTSDGAHLDFTPSTGSSHFALLDESPHNSTDFVSSTVVGNKETLGITIPSTAGAFFAMAVNLFAAKTDAGARTIRPMVRHAGVDGVGSDVTLGSFAYLPQQYLNTNPSTSADWTLAQLAAAEFGFEDRA